MKYSETTRDRHGNPIQHRLLCTEGGNADTSGKHAIQRRDPGKPISFVSPSNIGPKKNLDGKPKFRFCVELRALKSVTKFDSYPLPVIEETSSTLYGSKYYSVIYCFQGFWQINIREDHRKRKALQSRGDTVNSTKYLLDNRIVRVFSDSWI